MKLKSEIAAKLDAEGVKNYTLEIAAADQVKDRTVVESCEQETRRSSVSATDEETAE